MQQCLHRWKSEPRANRSIRQNVASRLQQIKVDEERMPRLGDSLHQRIVERTSSDSKAAQKGVPVGSLLS